MPIDLQEYRLWRKRIQDAEDFQAREHSRWQKALDLYSMRYWQDLGFSFSWDDQIVPVNYATTFVSTLLSAIFARNPKLFAHARRPRYAKFAETMDRTLERHWDEVQIKEVFLQVILDTLIYGIGWVECGFVPREEPTELPRRESQGMLQRLGEFFRGTEGEKPLPSQGVVEELRAPGEFFCVRRSPYDILIPPGPRSYWQLPYLIIHDRLTVEDFLANPSFKAKDRLGHGKVIERETKAQMVGPKYQFGSSVAGVPNDNQVVDLYTIWDKRSDSVFTLSKESEEAHLDPEDWPYHAEGFSAIPLTFNRIPNSQTESRFYPFGDIDPIFAQIIEKSKIRTQMVEHRRRANLVVFVQKGTTAEEELRNYAGATGAVEIVPVTNISAIQVAPPIGIPPAVLQTEPAIDADLHRDSGLQLLISDIARAGQIERATVATIVQGSANLKTGYRVDRIEAFAKHVGRFQAGIFWQHMRRFDVGEILGELPNEDAWPELPSDSVLARQRVRKELEFRIEAGSTRPIQDDVLDREQFIRASAVFQQVSPQLFRRIERPWWSEMAKRFRMPDLESLIIQATDEREAEVAQQENQLLLQNIPQIVGDCEDHETHLKVHAQASQQQSAPALDQHLLAHSQKLQETQAFVRRAGQGTRQSVQAPSAAEINQMGIPGMSNLMGQAMNLREGTGGETPAL